MSIGIYMSLWINVFVFLCFAIPRMELQVHREILFLMPIEVFKPFSKEAELFHSNSCTKSE